MEGLVVEKRAKMAKKSVTPDLGEHLVFCILLLLPAEILHKTMKLVCRQWRSIIHDPTFIKQHILKSDIVLLKQAKTNSNRIFSKHTLKLQNKESKPIVLKSEDTLQFPGNVHSCINGLVMFHDKRKVGLLYVSNPVTKETVKLPHCPSILYSFPNVTIVPDISGVEYKAVACYISSSERRLDVFITSVGKQGDFWRSINHNYPKESDREIPEQFLTYFRMMEAYAIAIEGFLFWVKNDCSYIISLDVKTEKFVEYPAAVVDARRNSVFYRKMRNKLSCIHLADSGIWAVYVLEECKGTGVCQWSKLYEINKNFGGLVPLAWNENGEVLILTCNCESSTAKWNPEVVAFNVVSKSSYCFSHGVKTRDTRQLSHVDSLVSLTSLN